MLNIPAIIAFDTIRDAQTHVAKAQMASSGQLCLQDAIALFERGEWLYAQRRALKSLAYSLGVVHPLYQAHKRAGAAIPEPT